MRPGDAIQWRCDDSGNKGVIRGWKDSPYDLRFPRPVAQPDWVSVAVPAEVAATLRGILMLDADTQRYVFRARATPGGAELLGSVDDLDELVGFVAAEANNDGNRANKNVSTTPWRCCSTTPWRRCPTRRATYILRAARGVKRTAHPHRPPSATPSAIRTNSVAETLPS